MRKSIFKSVVATAILVGSSVIGSTALAQGFPAKTINYIIPFNAGGESDMSARFQQAEFKKIAGVDVVIQYMAGAGGAQAWSQLNSMPADGYTVMGINLPHTVLQPMQKEVGYKTDELTPIHYFHYTPNAIFVEKDSPFKSLKDLVDYAKKNPGRLTFSGSGSNSANHLAFAQLEKLAGIKATYIPFSGTGPAVTAILGKQVMAGFNYAPSANKYGDKMRMLAVASEKRMPAFPSVPTFKELGYDIVGGAYRGVAVPRDTPESVRRKLSEIIATINKQPDFVKKMESGGFVLTEIDYEKMPAFMEQSKKSYAELGGLLGIKKK